MNSTEQAMRRTLASVDAPFYDIGILTDRGMFPAWTHSPPRSAWPVFVTSSTAMQMERTFTSGPPANGASPYWTTSAATPSPASRPKGFEPCAVIETSHENFQAWIKHSRVLSKKVGTFAAQLLAHRFGADPSAADLRRFGRLPGFTHRKPQHIQHGGLFPFIRLHTRTGQQFTAAEAFDLEADRLHQADTLARSRQRQIFKPWLGRATPLALSRFRAAAKYEGRPAAADMAFSISALASGWTESEIADALASEYLSRNPSQSQRAAYIRRTTTKAMLWVRA